MGKFSGAPYNGGYPYDNEPPEEQWSPGVGDKAKIACDWTMRQGQIGTVTETEPTYDRDGEIDGLAYILTFEDGGKDEFGYEDLIHPDAELWPPDEDDPDDEPISDFDCPKCESSNVVWLGGDSVVHVGNPELERVDFYHCNDCGHKFSV